MKIKTRKDYAGTKIDLEMKSGKVYTIIIHNYFPFISFQRGYWRI